MLGGRGGGGEEVLYRETERETERQRQRQTDRQTDGGGGGGKEGASTLTPLLSQAVKLIITVDVTPSKNVYKKGTNSTLWHYLSQSVKPSIIINFTHIFNVYIKRQRIPFSDTRLILTNKTHSIAWQDHAE